MTCCSWSSFINWTRVRCLLDWPTTCRTGWNRRCTSRRMAVPRHRRLRAAASESTAPTRSPSHAANRAAFEYRTAGNPSVLLTAIVCRPFASPPVDLLFPSLITSWWCIVTATTTSTWGTITMVMVTTMEIAAMSTRHGRVAGVYVFAVTINGICSAIGSSRAIFEHAWKRRWLSCRKDGMREEK